MKTFLLLTRALGIFAALLVLFGLGWSLFEAYLPLFPIADQRARAFLWTSLFIDFLPAVVVCLALLLPYSRISSSGIWRMAYGLLCGGAAYLVFKGIFNSMNDSNVLLSFAVGALPLSILISQLSVILIERLRRIQRAEQDAAANP